MKKSDLKNGAIVKLRNGDKYILLFDYNHPYPHDKDDILISLNDGCWLNISDYDEDLKDCNMSEFDIMKVAQSDYVGDDIYNHIINHNDEWTWVRDESEDENDWNWTQEETVMTISEIEEKLGISNLKIKKED